MKTSILITLNVLIAVVLLAIYSSILDMKKEVDEIHKDFVWTTCEVTK